VCKKKKNLKLTFYIYLFQNQRAEREAGRYHRSPPDESRSLRSPAAASPSSSSKQLENKLEVDTNKLENKLEVDTNKLETSLRFV
jgi:hypothetical protein